MQGILPDWPQVPALGRRRAALAVGVVALAALAFGWDLASEPLFPDETAYVSQSYFYDLLRDGRTDDWAWVEYHAYDLPPLPKYLFGLALEVSGQPRSNRLVAGRWFGNIRSSLLPRRMIDASRWASVLMAALGCGALYLLGAVAIGDRVGLLAAAGLAIDPLYRIHARRAMSEASVESLVLCTLLAALLALGRGTATTGWLPGRLGSAIAVGMLAGLAVLAKLSGGVALLVIAVWVLLPWAGQRQWRRLLPAGLWFGLVTIVAGATFVALNPFTRSHPTGPPPPNLMAPLSADQSIVGRLEQVVQHRAGVSREAQGQFPHDALATPAAKLIAVVAQGFGRFGPFGPRDHDSLRPMARVDPTRDRGALLWLPMVLGGLAWCGREGVRQVALGWPPTGWALVVAWLVVVGTVTAFIPLAWDRYFLPIQAVSILVGAAGCEALLLRVVPRPRAGGAPA